MTRFQYLMLCSMESGRTLSQAMEDAFSTASANPDWDVFERRPYDAWARADVAATG